MISAHSLCLFLLTFLINPSIPDPIRMWPLTHRCWIETLLAELPSRTSTNVRILLAEEITAEETRGSSANWRSAAESSSLLYLDLSHTLRQSWSRWRAADWGGHVSAEQLVLFNVSSAVELLDIRLLSDTLQGPISNRGALIDWHKASQRMSRESVVLSWSADPKHLQKKVLQVPWTHYTVTAPTPCLGSILFKVAKQKVFTKSVQKRNTHSSPHSAVLKLSSFLVVWHVEITNLRLRLGLRSNAVDRNGNKSLPVLKGHTELVQYP